MNIFHRKPSRQAKTTTLTAMNTNLKDFIYLDIDRVRSFVAQLYRGLPESFEETKGDESGVKSETEFSVPGLAKAGISGNILFQKSATETRSAHHYLYSLLEQRLKELKKIIQIPSEFGLEKWQDTNFEDGAFVLVKGKVQIIDHRNLMQQSRMIPRLIDYIEKNQNQKLREQKQQGKITSQQYEQQLKEGKSQYPPKEELEQITQFIDDFYAGKPRLKVFPFTDNTDMYFVGNTLHEHFLAAQSVPTFDSLSGEKWVVMGMINKPTQITTNPTPSPTNIEGMIEKVISAFQDLNKLILPAQFPAVSITPISIYRVC